jgi:hypothetical protein
VDYFPHPLRFLCWWEKLVHWYAICADCSFEWPIVVVIMSQQSIEKLGKSLPPSFSVTLILQQSPTENPWTDHVWEAVGILAMQNNENSDTQEMELIQQQAGVKRYRYRGFSLRLHVDECESYYHNLMAPNPRCYVVVSVDDNGTPQPKLLTLSFDEAHAYLEGDENLYTVPIPAEIYQWTEAYVLAHYIPQKRTKRQRQDWRQPFEARR